MTRVDEIIKRKFGDGDVNTPLKFKHVGQLSFMLSSIGSWPHKQFGNDRLDAVLTMYNMLLICLGIASPSLNAAYLWYYRRELTFFDMGHIVLTMCLTTLYLVRIIIARTKKYREAVQDWLLEFHLFYFKSRSQYDLKMFSQIHIISGMLTIYMQCLMCCGFILFSFQPWYNNYSKGMFGDNRPANTTFEHAVYYYTPFETVYTTLKGYWILFIINIFNTYNVSCGLASFDLLLSLIVFQIWGQLKVLKHNLLSFPRPEARHGMYSADENIKIRQLLQENIDHHKFLVKFVAKCSNAFSEYLFILYFLLQVISCILLLEMSSLTLEAFAKYGPLTVGLYQQLIQVSVLFEMLNSKSEQLIDAVYEVPWECMDTSNRKTVMFLLHRVQTPLSLKAGKVVPVGVGTMLKVLKTTFSYYMMLITVAREK